MIQAPVSMLIGKGSGPALLVIAFLVAAVLAQKSTKQKTSTAVWGV
jgi:hypothetical protein